MAKGATIALASITLIILGSGLFPGCALPRQTVSVLVTLPDTPELWVDAWGQAGYRVRWQAYATVSGVSMLIPG